MSNLQHHGIKGQKWGVRRFENKDGSLTPAGKKRYYKDYGDGRIEIEKGADMQRLVGSKHKTDLKGMIYTSVRESDNQNYMRKLTGPLGGGRDTKLTLTAKTALKSPSTDEAASIFFKTLKDNPKLNEAYSKAPMMMGHKYTDKELDDFISGKKKSYDDYQLANSQFMFDEAMSEVRNAYFNNVKKAGYNILRDENDIGSGYAKTPIIILDGDASVSIKSSEVITKAMRQDAKTYTKIYKKQGEAWADQFLNSR